MDEQTGGTSEATARAAQDSAIAGRVSTTEAQLRGDQNRTLAARVRDEAAVRASQDSAIGARASVLEARGGASGGDLIPQTQFYDFSGWEGGSGGAGQFDSRAINAPSADWYPPGANVFAIHKIGVGDNDNAAYWDYYNINVVTVEAGQVYQYYAYIGALLRHMWRGMTSITTS